MQNRYPVTGGKKYAVTASVPKYLPLLPGPDRRGNKTATKTQNSRKVNKAKNGNDGAPNGFPNAAHQNDKHLPLQKLVTPMQEKRRMQRNPTKQHLYIVM